MSLLKLATGNYYDPATGTAYAVQADDHGNGRVDWSVRVSNGRGYGPVIGIGYADKDEAQAALDTLATELDDVVYITPPASAEAETDDTEESEGDE